MRGGERRGAAEGRGGERRRGEAREGEGRRGEARGGRTSLSYAYAAKATSSPAPSRSMATSSQLRCSLRLVFSKGFGSLRSRMCVMLSTVIRSISPRSISGTSAKGLISRLMEEREGEGGGVASGGGGLSEPSAVKAEPSEAAEVGRAEMGRASVRRRGCSSVGPTKLCHRPLAPSISCGDRDPPLRLNHNTKAEA